MCSKTWAHRNAALQLILRRVMEATHPPTEITASGVAQLNLSSLSASAKQDECDVPKLLPASAKVFMQLASAIEMGLLDTVAVVRSS